ncbi:hypothetical protein SADUNF_Sadunf01G0131800 [Salix dunnii]|uniref:Uncharacterized protein n=1 Tax=Salix dunnii TaxID=1413687 RepID=A0A835NBW3_9ROSI|nr:hypothetical protein SADUNF_Sadunf01G0131800 [Salix dunnii]
MSLQPIDELPPKLQETIQLFQLVQEPKAKNATSSVVLKGGGAMTQQTKPKNIVLVHALLTELRLFTAWSSIGEFVMLPTEPRALKPQTQDFGRSVRPEDFQEAASLNLLETPHCSLLGFWEGNLISVLQQPEPGAAFARDH